jgi:hypothetical protein
VGAAARMSAAVAKRIQIDKFQALCAKMDARETAKYAQPCIGGVYMGIVNVHLNNRSNNGVTICGDGRMHRMTHGKQNEWMDTKPKASKYHKLEVQDRPPDNEPASIDLKFEFFLYKDQNNYRDGQTGPGYDADMETGGNYKKIICTIRLMTKGRFSGLTSAMFYEYEFHEIISMSVEEPATKEAQTYGDEITKEILTALAQKNRYTFEFQSLNAHPKMPGLYFAESVGWPSDQLAVLFGGRARHGGLENMEFFFAQHKFDTTEWDKMKQIHTALANVNSKIEYMYNYLSANPEPNIDTQATRRFCQQVLDYITEPYIHEVLKRMVLIKRENAEVHISEIRGVCEYVFQRDYPFLDTSTWTYVDGEFRNPVRVGAPTQLTSAVRILAYDVVSHCIESNGGVSMNPFVNSGKINAFSAYSVFEAYVSYAYDGKETPIEFKNVLEDARQLLANMQRLKTSSNFALKCLRDSCEIAAAQYSEFKMTSHYMLAASRVFITLLLQRDPSTEHEKFGEYTRRVASKLRANEHSAATNISTLEDYDTGTFRFDDAMSWSRSHMDHVKFECLVLATQLRTLSAMQTGLRTQNYFRFAEE